MAVRLGEVQRSVLCVNLINANIEPLPAGAAQQFHDRSLEYFVEA